MEVTLVGQREAFAYQLQLARGTGWSDGTLGRASHREDPARDGDIRVDAGHDLRISGPCSNRLGLYGLERVFNTNRDLAIRKTGTVAACCPRACRNLPGRVTK